MHRYVAHIVFWHDALILRLIRQALSLLECLLLPYLLFLQFQVDVASVG